MSLRRSHLAAFSMSIAFVLAGCAPNTNGSPGSGGDEEGHALKAGESRDIRLFRGEPTQGFDPAVARAYASTIPMGLMYSGLVERDQNGELVGALAESWDVSEDGLLWTFVLRDDARFSDGAPVTAADVKWTVEYLLGSEAMRDAFPDIDDIVEVDEKTVEFHLAEPAGRVLLQVLARSGSTGIISKEAVEAAGGPDSYFAQPAATSGPFELDHYAPGDGMTMSANEYFWRSGYPKAAGIDIEFVSDPAALRLGLESGEVDIAAMRAAEAKELLDSSEFNLYESETLTPTFWGMDHTQPPFDSLEVRQAIAWAVDREGPREACWFGIGDVSYGSILQPWDPFFVRMTPFDVPQEERLAKARKLLDSAGWIEGSAGGRVAQDVPGVPDGTPLAVTVPYEASWPEAECHTLILQQTLAEVGIEITPDKYDPASFWADVADNKFRMWHGGAAAPDGEAFYRDWFHSGGFLNPLTTKLNDPEIDKKIDEALTSTDSDFTAQSISELEEWQIDQVPLVVIGYQYQAVFARTEVKGFWASIDNALARPLSEAYIEE